MVRQILGALVLLSSIHVTAVSVRADLGLAFYVFHERRHVAGGQDVAGWRMLAYADHPGLLGVTISSPGGTFATTGDEIGQAADSPTFDSFASLQSAASAQGPWTVTVTSAAGTSTYQFTPDLFAVNNADLAVSTFVTPAPGAQLGVQPTFEWTQPVGHLRAAILGARSHDGSFYHQASVRNLTQYSFPVSFPANDYTVRLSLIGLQQMLPAPGQLISGLDLGPITARFDFSSATLTSFTLIPEPMSGSATGLVFLVSRRRWWR